MHMMKFLDSTHYVIKAELAREKIPAMAGYPFDLPAISRMDELVFHPKVTYIVGENGSGKSTLIEAIAVAFGFNAEGGSIHFNFSTRNSLSELYNYLKLQRGLKKPRDGFFLRAESFYNVATYIEELDATPAASRRIIDSYGGCSLHEQSHGEAFFSLFMNRFGGNGLYILDEPEAALSPSRQMAFLSRMHELVCQNSQFIIATHSPIIMAYPDAAIYAIDANGMQQTPYEKTDHFIIYRQFMKDYQDMLKILMT